ncbi:hypothetical protein [Paenibacillus sp. DCT19]|uniref:hypothetical protein n=1 Tax=Paenibacillus sp. DCT19 TaxID=2211212 RepID=UPI000FE1DBC9|nr:hypothetical protein [Paenibacillus sp. DCT19]
MKFTYQYTNEEERSRVLDQNSHLILIEEQNITEGNFLVFSDVPLPEPIVYVNVPQKEFESLKQDSTLLKAQSSALSERADFVEDVIAEMATQVYK